MGKISVTTRFPQSLHDAASQYANQVGVSLNQFIMVACNDYLVNRSLHQHQETINELRNQVGLLTMKLGQLESENSRLSASKSAHDDDWDDGDDFDALGVGIASSRPKEVSRKPKPRKPKPRR